MLEGHEISFSQHNFFSLKLCIHGEPYFELHKIQTFFLSHYACIDFIASPYHQHALDFTSKFKSLMQSRPTGRPKDIYKQVHDLYKETSKTLASLRPGGLAVSHKDRSDHNHAVWSVSTKWSNAAPSRGDNSKYCWLVDMNRMTTLLL